MSKDLTSHIFSLADPFEYQPARLNVFIELGKAAQDEYHIAIFNKNVVSSSLHIDYENAVEINPFCTLYSIINSRGSIYGTLFSVNKSHIELTPYRMIVHSHEKAVRDFTLYPYANEKANLLFYKDSVGTVLCLTAAPEPSPFLILDDKNGD